MRPSSARRWFRRHFDVRSGALALPALASADASLCPGARKKAARSLRRRRERATNRRPRRAICRRSRDRDASISAPTRLRFRMCPRSCRRPSLISIAAGVGRSFASATGFDAHAGGESARRETFWRRDIFSSSRADNARLSLPASTRQPGRVAERASHENVVADARGVATHHTRASLAKQRDRNREATRAVMLPPTTSVVAPRAASAIPA